MNVDGILQAFAEHRADSILIGGMNFLLRHRPITTFDVDLWIRDEAANFERVNEALRSLGAEWGPGDHDWKPVPEDASWLRRQCVYCLRTMYGALDIFTQVHGLEGQFEPCWGRAREMRTASGIPFRSLSDEDVCLPTGFAGVGATSGPGGFPEKAIGEKFMTGEEKQREEEKRDRMYDPVLRWRHIQETLTWAEANLPPHLRRNVPRRPKWQPESIAHKASEAEPES